MKLIKAMVHNFRGILEQEFLFNDYSLLVGANNAGKSSVIDAIRAFYEKVGFKYKKDRDFPFINTSDQESWVELTFELTQEENDSLADDYKNESNLLRVRKYFETNRKTSDNKSSAGSIFGYKGDDTLSPTPFYGAKNVQSGKIGDFVYIPAISKVDEHTKLTGPSALRDLLMDIMGEVIKTGDAYSTFSDAINVFSDAVRTEKTRDEHSLSSFETDLNDLIHPWGTKFKLNFTPPPVNEIVKSILQWDLTDSSHGKEQKVDCYGSGFQRHFIYSLIRLASKYVSKKKPKGGKEFCPSFKLVLFEEPEAYLHPPQQGILARDLRGFAQSGRWQVICSTHSAHFVSKHANDIPAVIRMSRESGEVRKFQISDEDWAAIIDANQAINLIATNYPKMHNRLHGDDSRPEMEAVKQFLWLNPDRSSLFFANHVLLVEGPTEVAIINRLVGDGRIRNFDYGIYVLDCIGKYNIHRFMNLLIYLGIPHSVIHDDDNDRNEHEDINRLIRDSAHESLTRCIKPIDSDLETMLGVPSTANHRKPQHLLYQFETGNIDDSKLQDFCSLIEDCLPLTPPLVGS